MMPQDSNHDVEDESPFFADITLDLAEAHDIAETPQPKKLMLDNTVMENTGSSQLHIPSLESPMDSSSGGIASATAPFTSGGGIQPSTTYATTIVEASSSSDGQGYIKVGSLDEPSAEMGRLESMNRIDGSGPVAHAYSGTPSSRRWPRDIQWAVAFCIVAPLSLLIPIVHKSDPTQSDPTAPTIWISTAVAPRVATLHSLWWGYIAVLVLSRILYRTIGGGDGDDARHVASSILLASAPISVSVYIALIVVLYLMTPKAFGFAIIPLWYLARDLFLFRTWKRTATTPGGRQAFFQALTCMTLDILSRALRRASFYRVTSILLLVQLGITLLWRMAILGALRSRGPFLLFLAIFGGKWATGTVARLLSLIASGGITSWFAEQSTLVAEMQEMNKRSGEVQALSSSSSLTESANDEGETPGINGMSNDVESIPEAYRSADASAYKSTLIADEGIDDDYDDDDDAAAFPLGDGRFDSSNPRVSTVKHFLFSGLSINFGSVAQCGLLGGLAQFIWSQLRKIDTARANLAGFRGMSIGSDSDNENIARQLLGKVNLWARGFVRSHSDMAMSHVAAYHKGYQRAAQDVAILVDESGEFLKRRALLDIVNWLGCIQNLFLRGLLIIAGVEPIIHDDISTHISACVGGTVSGIIVIFTGSVLVHQRNRSHSDVSDTAIVLDMLLAFVFCYTLVFTVMEPLRAGIKAVYVSFAEHPQSLSQAYPLIFHRLSRMSASNMS